MIVMVVLVDVTAGRKHGKKAERSMTATHSSVVDDVRHDVVRRQILFVPLHCAEFDEASPIPPLFVALDVLPAEVHEA